MSDTTVNVQFTADASGIGPAAKQAESGINDVAKAGEAAAASMKRAQEQSSDMAAAMRALNAPMNATKNDIKALGEVAGTAVWDFSPWSGVYVGMAQTVGTATAQMVGLVNFGALAVAAAFGAILAVITHSSAEFGQHTGEMAAEFGQSTEAIGRMAGVAAATGWKVGDLGAAMQKMGTGIKDGDDKVTYALKALGISADELKGKDMPGQLQVFAKHLSVMGDSANKTAAMVALFGDSAKDLLPVLNKGAASLADLENMAKRAGTELSGNMTASLMATKSIMTEVGVAFSELGTAFQGLGLAIFSEFQPAINGLIMWFGDLIKNLASFVEWISESIRQGGLMKIMLDGIAFGLQVVVSALIVATNGVQTFFAIASQVFIQIADLVVGLGKVMMAMWTDAGKNAAAFFRGLWEIAKTTVAAIGQSFVDLSNVLSKALSGDFAGAGAAFDGISAHAGASAAKIAGAFSGIDLSNTKAAFAEMTGSMGKDFSAFSDGVKKTSDQMEAQLKAVWGTAAAEKEKALTESGDPKVPDAASGGKHKGGKHKGGNDALREAQVEIDGEIAALKSGLEQKKALYEHEAKMKQITEDQKLGLIKAAVEEEYQAELALLQKQAALDGMKVSQRQAILNKIAALERQHTGEMLKMQYTAAETAAKAWQDAFSRISSSMSQSFMGMIQGTTTLKDAMRSLTLTIIQDFVQAKVKMVGEWLAAELAKTQATIAGATARAGAEQSGQAASILTTIGNALKSIASSVGITIAGVSAQQAPFVGPLAPAAGVAAGAAVAASAIAAVPAMDIGAYNIPGDRLALVHQNELIMPAGPAGAFRQMLEGGQNGTANSSGGDTHNHTVNISAVDAAGVARLFRDHGKSIWSGLNASSQRGGNLGLGMAR